MVRATHKQHTTQYNIRYEMKLSESPHDSNHIQNWTKIIFFKKISDNNIFFHLSLGGACRISTTSWPWCIYTVHFGLMALIINKFKEQQIYKKKKQEQQNNIIVLNKIIYAIEFKSHSTLI